MVATLNIASDFSALDGIIAALNSKAPAVMSKALLSCAQVATGEIRAHLQATTKNGRGGLARSFRERFIGDTGGVYGAESYSESVYGGIQDQGGVIKAGARKLAVPIKGANIAPGKWPRHFPKDGPNALHLIVRGSRPPLLVQKRGGKSSERWVPMFVLKTSVRIKPMRYIDAAAVKASPAIQQLIASAYASVLGAA